MGHIVSHSLTLHGDPWGEWQDTCTHCGEGGELIVCFACDLVAHDACADLDEDYHFARDEHGDFSPRQLDWATKELSI